MRIILLMHCIINEVDSLEGNFKKKAFGGYDTEEVDLAFISLNKKIEDQAQQIATLKEELQQVKEDKAMLINQTAITKQTNEEIARLAIKEASSLIDKAKKNANMILKESMDYVKGLDREVNGFKDSAIDFRAQVEKMSKDLLETIDKSEIFSLIKEENTKKETEDD